MKKIILLCLITLKMLCVENKDFNDNTHYKVLEQKIYNKPFWGAFQAFWGFTFVASALTNRISISVNNIKRPVGLGVRGTFFTFGSYIIYCGVKNIQGEKAYKLPNQ